MRSGAMRGCSMMLAGTLALVGLRSEAGIKTNVGDDGWMELSFLGQFHYSHMDDAAVSDDFYVRRARIILMGQIMDGVKFFAETDNDNAGRANGGTVSTDIQDAFLDIRLGQSDHWIKGGLLLLPFSFENRAAATKLLGLDYNAEAIRLVNSFVWRDMGAEIHGNVTKKFSYIIGAFDGYDTANGNKNPAADTRITGHVALNLVGEAETGWFYTQERLGNTAYFSLGAGIDQQAKATLVAADPATPDAVATAMDNEAWVVDFQSGCPLGMANLTVNGAYYDWDNSAYKGRTAFVESGLRVKQCMLTAKYAMQDPDAGEATDDYTVGIHHFLKGHNVRGGVEYRWGDSDEWILAGVQALL
jgi:hypothetical protein